VLVLALLFSLLLGDCVVDVDVYGVVGVGVSVGDDGVDVVGLVIAVARVVVVVVCDCCC